MNKRLLLSVGLLSGISTVSNVWAQSTPASTNAKNVELEEIIVTAERRTSDVQKTAAAISVRSGDDLNKQGKFSLQQILEDVPNVAIPVPVIDAGNTDTPGGTIVIRGVQSGAGVPSTATYTDGVYSGIGGDYDIDRVEVLRGPQGTLYGRSATGGVVATYTHAPELGNIGATGSAEVGSYNLRHATVAINIPVDDVLAIRVAGNRYQRDGYVSADGGKTQTTSGKLKLLYKPTDDLSVLLGVAQQDNHRNTGGVLLGQSSPGVVSETTAPIAAAADHFRQAWVNVDWNLGFGTLTYLPAIRTWEQNAPSVIIGPGGAVLDQVSITPTDRYWTHEVRLASNPGSTVSWLAGALYYDNKRVGSTGVTVHSSGNTVFLTASDQDTTDTGIFGEATLPFANTWRVTGGVRYDKTKIGGSVDYTTSAAPFAPGPSPTTTSSLSGDAAKSEFNNVTFKARLEKDLTSSNMAYAMVSSGFLPGNVQLTSVNAPPVPNAPPGPPLAVAGAITYDQEKLLAYELGSKNRFLVDTLQLNGDVFYYDYAGYQTNTNTSVGNPAFAIVTSPARMYGVELDGQYLITPQDRIGASFSYINAKYVDKTALFAQYIANDAIANIPPITYSASYDHTFKLGGSSLVFHADARYASSHISSNYLPNYVGAGCGPTGAQDCLPYINVDSQVVGNVSVTWTSAGDNYSITGYVRNVANNDYIVAGSLSGYNYDHVANPAAPPNSFSAGAVQYDPRTIGVVLNFKF